MKYCADVSNYAANLEALGQDWLNDALRSLVYSERLERIAVACNYAYVYEMFRTAVIALNLGTIATDAYIYLYGTDWTEQINAGLANIGSDVVDTLWLDIEDETNAGVTQQGILDAVARVRASNNSFDVGIYSRADFWLNTLGNPQVGHACKLWLANWTGTPSPSFDVNFGGWLRASMIQYRGNYQSYGLNVDMNVYE